MAKYYFTNKAVDDLSEIWNYTIETWSEMQAEKYYDCLLYTSPSPRDRQKSRMPSSA